MSVVKIDERGRMTLPKSLRKGELAVVIDAGTFAVVVPIPKSPEAHAMNWLRTKKSAKELKSIAEKSARMDALSRSRRHKQL